MNKIFLLQIKKRDFPNLSLSLFLSFTPFLLHNRLEIDIKMCENAQFSKIKNLPFFSNSIFFIFSFFNKNFSIIPKCRFQAFVELLKSIARDIDEHLFHQTPSLSLLVLCLYSEHTLCSPDAKYFH